MAEVAGDLWLLIVHLAEKNKLMRNSINHVMREDDRDMIQDFLNSSGRLWDRLKKLINICRVYIR